MSRREVVRSGYLTKQGGRWKTWKKRWFVLRGKILYYYKNPTKKLPLGMMPLTGTVDIEIATSKRRKKYLFTINVPGQRRYLINAMSEEDRDEWISALQSTIRVRKTDKISLRDFDLLAVLGRGTYGKVMQVRKRDTKEIFAMKILQKGMLADHQQIAQTMAERNVLMRTTHPFMISLRYSFQTVEKLYMVLDFASGGELFHTLRNEGRFPESRTILYAAEILLALEHLHKMDIVYRDLKPENVLMEGDGHLKITDFGLVKMDLNKQHGGKTRTFCGTPEYLAPEILLDRGYDEGVDWWSLGILIYEMMVGMPPFYSENRTEMFRMIINDEPPMPSILSANAEDLINNLLTKDPTKRLGHNGSSEIKSHKWFSGLDWEQVMGKEITPEYIPVVEDPTDLSHFDEEFTEEDVVDSLPQVSVIGRASQEEFKGFTYIAEIEGISSMT